MKYDCVIVGGGLSGLAAGIRLAHYDKRVCICERHSRLGGLNSYYRRGKYDFETGLHAMTNFAPPGSDKSLPMNKIIRQLRIPRDALRLREQNHSMIRFPGASLSFNNDFRSFEQSVRETFPDEIEAFQRLNRWILEENALDLGRSYCSAREAVSRFIRDPLLIDMIFCPLMYYGSAVEDDMDAGQFVIMFKSIFHEGFCRPGGDGIRSLLDILEDKFVGQGGELRTRCGIRRIHGCGERALWVETDDGEIIESDRILSCAGFPETMALCDVTPPGLAGIPVGNLAFVEAIAVVDSSFLDGLDTTIQFFSTASQFRYRRSSDLVDTSSGVICVPGNFRFLPGDVPPAPMLRVTALTNYDQWPERDDPEYARRKDAAASIMFETIEPLIGKAAIRQNARFLDVMSPRTIHRFTGRIHGAIYGSPTKIRDGRTHLKNLFICGTDQGFLGIAGSILSGISIANLHLLDSGGER